MLKKLSNLGSVLNKAEQRLINGGGPSGGSCYLDCDIGWTGDSCNTIFDCVNICLPGAPVMCDHGCCMAAI